MNYLNTTGSKLIVSPYGNYTFIVLEDYTFTNSVSGVTYTVPKNFITDGASIPRVFWSVFGGPFCPKNLEASIQHDFLISEGVPGSERDLQFYSVLVKNGTDKWKARIMYLGVVAWRKIKSFLT